MQCGFLNSILKFKQFSVELLILYSFLILLSEVHGDDCISKKLECEKSNASKKLNKVCGSDNTTYNNICYINMENCRKGNVSLQHNGRCRAKKPCFKVLKNLDKVKKPSQMSFIPTCLEDGRYAPVQCHKQTGYCWCVTPKGRPVPNTSRRHQKPNCQKRVKTRRRASARNKEYCSNSDKHKFITNMLSLFKTEYGVHGKDNHEIDDEVINWKFEALDVNADDFLQRQEYRVLKKVKRVIKPKKCFKLFARICDRDRDMRISREEWSICLNVDFTFKGTVTLTGQLPGLVTKRKDEPETNDCLSDRQAVLSEQKENDLYVPECTPDGRYSKIQCYKSTGYCWCVYEDDGKPIPGTSVKDQVPKCDSVPAPVRPMKGCPGEKKSEFLKHLNEFLTEQMNMKNTSDLTSQSVPTWSFSILDVNNNKFLERKEWKTFRALVANIKTLRRCGKRLPKYCDINNDRKISITEWFNCLDSQKENMSSRSIFPTYTGNQNSKRKGPNPLESLLKDDD